MKARTRSALIWLAGTLTPLMGFVVYAWRPAIAPLEANAPGQFAQAAINRGAQLAALGNCATCHTAYGGAMYSGGRKLATAFGNIYSTNITPEAQTGIGKWSLEAFQRAMRQGVDREGRHLYPAFPYDHFTLVTDADNAALYAFLMTRKPVRARTPENELSFPLNVRMVIAGWKLLFLHTGPYDNAATQDVTWNRGAYLVNGLAHCGGCHTPRNDFGAENSQRFSGADAEGWHAFAIDSRAHTHEAWTADSLYAYLRHGWQEQHGDAYGPMASVVQNLAVATDEDLRAISIYMASRIDGQPAPAAAAARPPEPPQSEDTGAQVYAATCQNCHDGSRPLPFGGVRLTLSTAVTGESATNLINIILHGLNPAEVSTGAMMPGFGHTLTDAQLESLVSYIRSAQASRPAWADVDTTVRAARSRDHD